MRARLATALGAILVATAGSALAQAPTAAPAGQKPILRPFGSVPLMVPPSSDAPRDCDDACLKGLAQQYMDALVKQDGSKLPWADRVRYAENGVTIMVSDGTWATATAKGASPLIVADAKAGKAVWIGSVDEHGQPGFYAIELTARGGRIVSVQATIRRQQGRPPFGDPIAFTHDPAFSATVAKGKETPRAIMSGLVQAYFEAQGGKSKAPAFGKGCVLIENGVPMTGNLPAAKGESGDCATSFSRGLFGEFEAIRRRIVAYDDARGLVVVSGVRDLPGATTSFTGSDGKGYKSEADYPRSFGFVTVFKIEGNAIARVESIATELPYLMPPPWQEPRGPRP
ncbi:MAG: hypothetical protein J7498_12355 [Sphingobium sp.]|nr:hypothetical protein [Sphingobium sp.]